MFAEKRWVIPRVSPSIIKSSLSLYNGSNKQSTC